MEQELKQKAAEMQEQYSVPNRPAEPEKPKRKKQ
jgi:hypothetical protein